MVVPNSIDNPLRSEAISQQRVIRVVLMKPCQYLIDLRMQDEFASFEPDGRPACDATALHDAPDVVERQVFPFFLPDVAVLAM